MRAYAFAAALALTVTPALAQQPQPTAVQQHKVDVALRIVTRLMVQYSTGTATVDEVGMWIARWYSARRDTGLIGPPLVVAAQDYVNKMRALEQVVQSRVQAGAASSVDADKAEYYRLEAESVLAKLKTP